MKAFFRSVALATGLLLSPFAGTQQGWAEDVARIRDVVYGRKFGMALTMDVLKPAKPNGIGVIYMVSGGFSSDITWIGSGFVGMDLFKQFTDRGDTVFLVCHGAQPKFLLSEILQDIHRAVRFVRVHASEYGVDPNRLGISGASSGGYLSLSIGTSAKLGDPDAKDPVDRASSKVQAVACFFPPSDLVDYGKAGRNVVEYEPVKFIWHIFGILDKPKEEQNRVLREFSPYAAISTQTPPTLIIHGDADELVPIEQSERFAAKLEELKVPHQLDIRKGAGHGWTNMAKDFAILADWFDKELPAAGEKR